jgi:hypothetical protein
MDFVFGGLDGETAVLSLMSRKLPVAVWRTRLMVTRSPQAMAQMRSWRVMMRPALFSRKLFKDAVKHHFLPLFGAYDCRGECPCCLQFCRLAFRIGGNENICEATWFVRRVPAIGNSLIEPLLAGFSS